MSHAKKSKDAMPKNAHNCKPEDDDETLKRTNTILLLPDKIRGDDANEALATLGVQRETGVAFRKELYSLIGNAMPYSNDDQKLLLEIVSEGVELSLSFVSKVILRFGVHFVSSILLKKAMEGVAFVHEHISLH